MKERVVRYASGLAPKTLILYLVSLAIQCGMLVTRIL